MSDALTDLLAARERIDSAIAALGGQGQVSSDDPMTAPLDQRGVWNPSWLRAANAQVEALNPGLMKVGPAIGLDGRPVEATPIRLISGFIFQPIAQRADISQAVRDLYQREHNRTFLAATTGDFGRTLAYLPLDADGVQDGPGYFVASLHSIHQDPEEVKEKLLRLYRIHDLLP